MGKYLPEKYIMYLSLPLHCDRMGSMRGYRIYIMVLDELRFHMLDQ